MVHRCLQLVQQAVHHSPHASLPANAVLAALQQTTKSSWVCKPAARQSPTSACPQDSCAPNTKMSRFAPHIHSRGGNIHQVLTFPQASLAGLSEEELLATYRFLAAHGDASSTQEKVKRTVPTSEASLIST